MGKGEQKNRYIKTIMSDNLNIDLKDSDGNLISIKRFYFRKEGDNPNQQHMIGSEIIYSSNRKTKNIIHH